MTEQPEALRLADALKGQVQVNPRVGENDPDCGYVHELDKLIDEAAAELRRLHEENERLRLENGRWEAAVRSCVEMSNGRESEWGDRAQWAFGFLHAAIARAEEPKP